MLSRLLLRGPAMGVKGRLEARVLLVHQQRTSSMVHHSENTVEDIRAMLKGRYARVTSDDSRYPTPAYAQYNTIGRFFKNTMFVKFELWPLFFLGAMWVVIFIWTVAHSLSKQELWLNRATWTPPWDWSRIHDNYWNKPMYFVEVKGSRERLPPIHEALLDELVLASIERGTRGKDGRYLSK